MTPFLKTLQPRESSMRQRRASQFQPAVEWASEKTHDAISPSFAAADGYQLTVACRVQFWANRAQLEDARRNARLQLLAFIYGEPRGQIAAIRSAIFAGDAEAALELLDDLEREYRYDL